MSDAPVRDLAHGCELDVLVAPRASRSKIVGLHDGRLKIQLAAPPVDGAANTALVDLLAATLELPRSALEIARGATGRRKTVRIASLDAAAARARLGLAGFLAPLLAPLLAALACTAEVPFPVKVILPGESADLNRADNLSLELGPDGYYVNYPVRGTEFGIELEFEPDTVTRSLSLYLADGTELLAYGRSAPFVLLSPPADLAVLMARPGVLSIYPGDVAEPDPDLLAVHAPGFGLALLSGAGDIALLNETNFNVELGARLGDPPEPGDGAFIADHSGRLWRIGLAAGLGAARYDPGLDLWATATVADAGDGAADLPRPGAAWALAPARDRLYIAGGAQRTDLLALSLAPDDDGVIALSALAELDQPRPGARLLALPGDDDDDTLILVGGEADAAVLYFPDAGHSVGPVGPWTGLQCAALDLAADPGDAWRLLCIGGLRGAQPTADALLVAGTPDPTATTVDLLPNLFTDPLADPRLFADDLAIYAQNGAQWWRVGRSELDVTLADTAATRVYGGHSITLGTGVTFLVGGRDPDDRAVDRWWMFTPSLAPTQPSP